MRHEFHPESALEFAEAVQFYQARGPSLGQRFAAEIRAAITRAVTTPERWPALEADVRRCLVRVFPYAVLYIIEEDYLLIIAIMHGKRQPGYWRHRLKSRPLD